MGNTVSRYVANNISKPKGMNNSDWEAIVKANPYTQDKWSRKQSAWENALGFFGIRSGYDDYIDQMQIASDSYYADAISNWHKEHYDTAQAQANREREAGLNPDIAGGVSPGEGQGLGEEQVKPDLSLTTGDGTDIFGKITSLFSFIVSATQGVQSIIGTSVANKTAKVAYANKMENFIGEFLNNYAGTVDNNTGSSVNNANAWDNIFRSAKAFSKSYKLKKSEEDMFLDRLRYLRNSSKGQTSVLKNLADAYSSRKNALIKMGSKYGGSQVLFEDFEEVLKNLDPLIKAADKIEKLGLEVREKQLKFEGDYKGTADGTIAGEAFNAQNENVKSQQTAQQIAESARAEVMKSLDEQSKQGGIAGFLAQITKLAMPYLDGFLNQRIQALGAAIPQTTVQTGPAGQTITTKQ